MNSFEIAMVDQATTVGYDPIVEERTEQPTSWRSCCLGNKGGNVLGTRHTTDPRVRWTKQRLQQAFLDLARIKNFDALTVKDITERAEVNRATFYAHFDNK